LTKYNIRHCNVAINKGRIYKTRNAEILLHMEVVTVNFDHFHCIGYDWREICVLKAK